MVKQPEQILPSKKHPAEAFLIATKAERALQLAHMPPMVSVPFGSTEETPIPIPAPSVLRVVTPRFRQNSTEAGGLWIWRIDEASSDYWYRGSHGRGYCRSANG